MIKVASKSGSTKLKPTSFKETGVPKKKLLKHFKTTVLVANREKLLF